LPNPVYVISGIGQPVLISQAGFRSIE
jgi:hypothetical protein